MARNPAFRPVRDHLGNAPVDKITRAMVLQVLRPIWTKTPETATRLRGRIEQVLAAAYVELEIEDKVANPAQWKNKLVHVLPKPPAPKRRLSMPYKDVPHFVRRLRHRPEPSARALEFIVLTAVRSNEGLGAKWDEVDLDERTWTVPVERLKASKEPHAVPLSDQAIRILKAQWEKRPEGHPFVFPGLKAMQPVNNSSFHKGLLQRMDVNVDVHGFRSSFRNFVADQGFEFVVGEACLAHKIGNQVTQAYLHTTMPARRREAMEKWGAYCDPAPEGGKVIPIARARV
jgi:integrase